MASRITLIRYLIALVVAAATFESAARIDDYLAYGAPLLGPYSPAILYTNDELGMCGRPHARYVKWQFNSLGYRSPELDPGRTRIITIGSSETFGLYESIGREYPRLLETELNRRAGHPIYQVFNVAYPGLTNTTVLRRLPVILPAVRPKVAVIYPSLANYIYLPPDPNVIPRAHPVNPFEPRITGKMKTVVKEVLPAPVQTLIRTWEIDGDVRGGHVLERLPEENINFFRKELKTLLKHLQAADVHPLLVTHATRFGEHITPEERPALIAWRKFYPTLAEEGFLDMERRLNQVIREEAALCNVPVADASREMPAGPRYFADFVHFSDEGALAISSIISEKLYPLLLQLRLSSER